MSKKYSSMLAEPKIKGRLSYAIYDKNSYGF